MFSDATQSILTHSGWVPSRKVSTSHWISTLEDEGFTICSTVQSILESFGGLNITPKADPNDTFLKGTIRFDPVVAASGEFMRIYYWQAQTHTILSPIAEGSKGEILLAAEDGRIFSCYESQLFLDGVSFEDAMNNTFIIARRKSMLYGQRSE